METQDQNNIPSATASSNDSIFKDVVDTEPYQKGLKNARIWLYVVSGFHLVFAIINYFTLKDQDEQMALMASGIYVAIAAIFFALALWSYKKPTVSFLVALILYIAFIIGFALLDPANLVRGVIIRILVIVALFKGYTNAKQVEKLRESMGN